MSDIEARGAELKSKGYRHVGTVWGHDWNAFEAGKIDKPELYRRFIRLGV